MIEAFATGVLSALVFVAEIVGVATATAGVVTAAAAPAFLAVVDPIVEETATSISLLGVFRVGETDRPPFFLGVGDLERSPFLLVALPAAFFGAPGFLAAGDLERPLRGLVAVLLASETFFSCFSFLGAGFFLGLLDLFLDESIAGADCAGGDGALSSLLSSAVMLLLLMVVGELPRAIQYFRKCERCTFVVF